MKNNLEQIKEILTSTGKKLCTIESCTGGNIASLITSIPGSSDFFVGGLVSYSNNIKNKVLGVEKNLLKGYDAVSLEVAEDMLLRGLDLFNSDYGIATTGFTGPTGGTTKYPLGTIVITYGSREIQFIEILQFSNNRSNNIKEASSKSLDLLLDYLQNKI